MVAIGMDMSAPGRVGAYTIRAASAVELPCCAAVVCRSVGRSAWPMIAACKRSRYRLTEASATMVDALNPAGVHAYLQCRSCDGSERRALD